MKICIVGDVHWSEYSSIVRKQGMKYSQRLENLIKTINWCEQQSRENYCSRVIYLGDFFDKPHCNDREITALKDIEWNTNITHDFLVGNHESSVSGLRYNSTKILERTDFHIIDKVKSIRIGDVQLCYYPYITEDERKPLSELIELRDGYKHVAVSHNDIKGISFGQFMSESGFDVNEINDKFDLFINGHLHNGIWIGDKILNVGNITGQNFGENAYDFPHHICILDVDTLEVEFIENPYALNFLQVDIKNENDINNLKLLKDNMVVNFKCNENLVLKLKEKVAKLPLTESRIMSVKVKEMSEDGEDIFLDTVDSNKKFTDFMLEKLGNSDIVKQEILEVIK